MIDTGGYVEKSKDIFEEEINKQVHLAIGESDIILFMVDVTFGIHELDKAIAELLRKTNKKVIIVVNKVDNNERLINANEFYSLGMGNYFPVSSINGSGTGDLLDTIVKNLWLLKKEGFVENRYTGRESEYKITQEGLVWISGK